MTTYACSVVVLDLVDVDDFDVDLVAAHTQRERSPFLLYDRSPFCGESAMDA